MNPTFDNIIQLGLRAHGLAMRSRLEDRLPAGALDQLLADVETLKSLVPEAVEVRRVAQASTATEQAALARGYEVVRGVRKVVRSSGATTEVRKHYGVGATCNPRLHSDVVSLLEQILNRATAEPTEAQSVGIVPEDLDNVRAALAASRAADKVQRDFKIKSPITTQNRREVAERVMGAARRISCAGLARFANQPAAADFEALATRRRRAPSGPSTSTPPSSVPLAS